MLTKPEPTNIAFREVIRHHNGHPYTLKYDGNTGTCDWKFTHPVRDGKEHEISCHLKDPIPDTLKGNTELEKYFEILSISVAQVLDRLENHVN